MKQLWLGISISFLLSVTATAASADRPDGAIEPSGRGHSRPPADVARTIRAPRPPRSASSVTSCAATRFQLMAVAWSGELFDLDLATATLSNPRVTGIDLPSGLATSPDCKLYASRAFVLLDPTAPGLYRIDDAVLGAATPLGPAGMHNIIEGDIDFDPVSGKLYGLWAFNPPFSSNALFTYAPTTGAATAVADLALGDPSAIAFDDAGTMYVFDEGPDALHVVDPETATVLRTVPLRTPVTSFVAGMDFDPTTGKLYLATGEPDMTLPGFRPPALYELDVVTGDVIEIGLLATGISGLRFVPVR